METLKDCRVAITGAAHGIGEQLALECGARGADLALADIDADGLAETARRVSETGAQVHQAVVDVADRTAVQQWADEVAGEYPAVDLLVNNAGVTLWATIEQMAYENFRWLMEVDFWGVVHTTMAFLPRVRRAEAGRIVNVSSAFGMIGAPCLAAYSSAKFAVRGFSHALRSELELEGSDVEVMCAYPGSVATDNVRRGRFDGTGPMGLSREELLQCVEQDLSRTEPRKAACDILDGVVDGKQRVLIGMDAVLCDLVQRVLPGSYPEPAAHVIDARLTPR
jgi:NAD(P)-dependent dehydrogenase (short-subunit alcohol dehydrogenase family)